MLEFLRKYRLVFLATTLVIAALLLYSVNLRNRSGGNLFERGVLRVMAPLQSRADGLIASVADLWGRYLWLVDTQTQNLRLQEENRQLRSQVAQTQEVFLANERLKKLLELRDTLTLPAVPARVVGEDISSFFRSLVIDKGRRDGVAAGAAVVVSEGVVGRVLNVSETSSQVLMIGDASSAVAALVQRTRSRGICRGQGDSLNLDYVLRQEDVQVGDLVISSGLGGAFPKGIVLGTVTEVVRGDYGLFQEVRVTPQVDFSRLEEVLVLRGGS